MTINLSVVVPCYNEAENIPLVLERFSKVFKEHGVEATTELIIVNNNSKDNSADVLERELKKKEYSFARTVFQPIPGYGAAIRKGLESAHGEFLCWTHADLQTDPADVVRAYTLLQQQKDPKNCYIKGDRKGRPLFDQAFTTGMSLFETAYLGTILHDINAQPNLFHSSFFKKLPHLPDDFSLDLCVLYLAKRMKLDIVRFPVPFKKRIHGESSWNTSLSGKYTFIKRTLDFTFKLDKKIAEIGFAKPPFVSRYVGLLKEVFQLPFVLFCFIGGLSTVLNYTVFYALFQLLVLNYILSSAVGYVSGVLFSFAFNKKYTFKSEGQIGRKLARYFGVYTFSLVIGLLILQLLVSVAGVHPLLANALVIIVTTLTNFFGCKLFVFK